MSNFNKIKVIIPNGEEIECENLIALLRSNNNFMEDIEEIAIGDWTLESLVESKLLLNEMIDDQIKTKLNPKEKLLFEAIQAKEKDYKNNFKDLLSVEEEELYEMITPELQLIMAEEILEDINEEDLERVFNEIFEGLETCNDSGSIFADQDLDSKKESSTEFNKVIDIESYKNK